MSAQTRKARSQANREVFRMGYSHGMYAFGHAGHTRINPSITERELYRTDWHTFMQGWIKAARVFNAS